MTSQVRAGDDQILHPCHGDCDTAHGICSSCGLSIEEQHRWPEADFGERLAIRGRARARREAVITRQYGHAA